MKRNDYLLLPEGYEIRKATIDDAEAISLVHVNSWKTSYSGIVDQAYLNNLHLEDRLAFRKKILIETIQSYP